MFANNGFERVEQSYQILKKLNYLEDDPTIIGHQYFGGHSVETVLSAAIEMILEKTTNMEYQIKELQDRIIGENY